MGDGEDSRSAWDSRYLYSIELSRVRVQLHEARWARNLDARFECLVSLFITLSARMNEKSLNENKQQHENIVKLYCNLKQKNIIRTEELLPFDEWEISLRREENKLGLLVPDRDDPRFAR